MKTKDIKINTQYYFDVLGKTNKGETLSVTTLLVKRNKVYVMSDQTREYFKCSPKYLFPITDASEQKYLVRMPNQILNIDSIDYETLKDIKNYINSIPNQNKETLNKINLIMDTMLCKMALIVKNEQCSTIIKNVIDKDFSNVVEANRKANDSSSKSFVDFKSSSTIEDPDKLNNIQADLDDFLEQLSYNISDTEINDCFIQNFPIELLKIENYNNSGKHEVYVNDNEITEISKNIVKLLEISSKACFPYIHKCGEVAVSVFSRGDSLEKIEKELRQIIVDQYDHKIPFMIQLINKTINNEEFESEENDYE